MAHSKVALSSNSYLSDGLLASSLEVTVGVLDGVPVIILRAVVACFKLFSVRI